MSERKFTSANILAIIAFAILFIIAIWSGIQIVKIAPRVIGGSSFFSFFQGNPEIELLLDKGTVKNSEEFTVKWNLKGKIDGGTISFLYKCSDGVVLNVFDDISGEYKVLPCNAPFNMPLDSKELKVKAENTSSEKLRDVMLAIVYTNSKGEKVKDIKKISVENPNADTDISDLDDVQNDNGNGSENKNDNGETANDNTDNNNNQDLNSGKEGVVNSSTQSNTTSGARQSGVKKSPNSQCQSKVYGKPDLSIHNLRVGVLDSNGYLVKKSTFYEGETITIKFTVSNYGTKTSPVWYFQALLPTRDGQIYTSQAQPKIAPCSGRFYTLRVQNPKKGTHNILVDVDPQNLIRELNEINNSASVNITVY